MKIVIGFAVALTAGAAVGLTTIGAQLVADWRDVKRNKHRR